MSEMWRKVWWNIDGREWWVIQEVDGRTIARCEFEADADAIIADHATASGVRELEEALAEKTDEAKKWRAYHDHQVRMKRDGHAKQQAHYVGLITPLQEKASAVLALIDAGELHSLPGAGFPQGRVDALRDALAAVLTSPSPPTPEEAR